jgi:hypothetical protein
VSNFEKLLGALGMSGILKSFQELMEFFKNYEHVREFLEIFKNLQEFLGVFVLFQEFQKCSKYSVTFGSFDEFPEFSEVCFQHYFMFSQKKGNVNSLFCSVIRIKRKLMG